MLVQDSQNIIDDLVFCLRKDVRFREGCFGNLGARILATKLGNDVVEVLLAAESLSFQELDDGGDAELD